MSQLDFALLGNCQISALVDKKAQVVWCCMPRFDSPSIFSALLGGDEAGLWSCLPDTNDFETKQHYLSNTNVVQTEFHLKNGDRYDILDFAPRFSVEDTYYRPPQLMRVIRPVKGNPRLRIRFHPKFEYGKEEAYRTISTNGLACRSPSSPDKSLFLQTDIPTTYVMDGSPFEISGNHYFILSYGEPFRGVLKFACEEYLDRTIAYWRTWVKHCNIPFEYQQAVIRSALALKLHVYEDTGAIIAATTTSIPESETGGRTWDYRYCWLRDSYFVIHALNQLGQFEEMERFIQYLHNIAVTEPDAELQPVYGVGGERKLTEIELPWLKGFKNIRPVRVGNSAYAHSQYDAYGEMVLSVTRLFFDSRLNRIDITRAFENVVKLVDKAIKVFPLPDSGIWEFRTDKDHFLFSKIMCWAAVDRGLRIAGKIGKRDQFPHWHQAEKQMRSRIETEGWNDKEGFYTQTFHGEFPDASNLLMAALQFHEPSDARYLTMVKNYEKTLLKEGHVFRYQNEDGFGLPSKAFTVCTFWMVDALAAIGRKEEARRIFEGVLKCANHLGLLSEDIDPKTGDLWGNFPQAYSHVGVINSAFRLSRSWEEAF